MWRRTATACLGRYFHLLVAAYFKETQINHVQPGDQVRITLMGHAGQPFAGEVVSTAWGIFVQDGSTTGNQMLPDVQQTVDWVRLPNASRCACR